MAHTLAERWTALFKDECEATRRVIGALPDDRHAFRPHPKSMTAGELAWHIAGGFKWEAEVILSGHDYIVDPTRRFAPPPGTTAEILDRFAKFVEEYGSQLSRLPDEIMDTPRSLCMPDGKPAFTLSIMSWLYRVILVHMAHHRGQLGVYLRLMDIPVPGACGPSADEKVR